MIASTATIARTQAARAQRLLKSNLLPAPLQGNLAAAEELIDLADAIVVHELVLAFNLRCYEGGEYGWSSAFYRAMAHRLGVFKGPIKYQVTTIPNTELIECTAKATLANTGDEVETTVQLASFQSSDLIEEGHGVSEMWKRRPEYMLKCAAARELISLYCPEVMIFSVMAVFANSFEPPEEEPAPEDYSQDYPDEGGKAAILEDEIHRSDDLGDLSSLEIEINKALQTGEITHEQADALKVLWYNRRQMLTLE